MMYLVAVVVATGLVATGFLLSGAVVLALVAALAVDAVADASPPGRSDARLVLGGGTVVLAGSFAAAGFASVFGAAGLVEAGLGLDAIGLGFDAVAAGVGFVVVGVRGAASTLR